jgi:hypothetical protein
MSAEPTTLILDFDSTIVAAEGLDEIAKLALAVLSLPRGADIVETGAYMGGATGLMLRALQAFDGCARRVWVFDSFAGLPAPDADADLGAAPFFEPVHPDFTVAGALTSPEAAFWATLARLGHDARAPADAARLVVVRGWFNETLAAAPVRAIGLLHLDGDLFSSTWDALAAFYDRVVPGGYVYVDDYMTFRGCAEAVDTFRWVRGIGEPLRYVREEPGLWEKAPARVEAVFWRKAERAPPRADGGGDDGGDAWAPWAAPAERE